MIADVFTLSNYFFNIHSIVPAFISFSLVVIAILFIMRAGWTTESITMLLLWTAIEIWFFSFAWMYSARVEHVAFWWGKAAYLGIPFISAATYHFTLSLVKIHTRYRKDVIAMWIVSAILCISAVGTPFIITGMYRYSWGYHPLFGPFGIVFIGVFIVPLMLSLLHMQSEYRRTAPGSVQRKRIAIFMTAVGVASLGTFDFLMNFHIAIFPAGGISVLAALIIIVVGIWRYQLVELTPSFAASNIIDTMDESLFVLDDEWAVKLTNKAAPLLTGIPEKEILGRTITEIFNDEVIELELGKVMNTHSIQHFELNHRMSDGSFRTLNISASVMNRKDGKLLAIVCVARDITAQKQAEIVMRAAHDELEVVVAERTSELERTNKQLRNEIEERLKTEDALRTREERYRTLFESSLDAIFILDHDKVFIDANPAAHALFVATRDEMIGTNIRKFIIDSNILEEIFKEIDDTGLVLEREIRARDRYGKVIMCILTASLWKDDKGVPIGYQGILRDVTQERQAEEEILRYE